MADLKKIVMPVRPEELKRICDRQRWEEDSKIHKIISRMLKLPLNKASSRACTSSSCCSLGIAGMTPPW